MEGMTMPNMYDVHLEDSKPEELYDVYSKDILSSATTAEVEKAMVEYANTLVEPTGWNGVWKATSRITTELDADYDFYVEVLDVSMSELQSRIKVLSVLPVSNENVSDVAASVVGSERVVPLVELFPDSKGDGEENFLRTAVAIEYIRFFYQNIWRPWDEEEDDNFIFAEKFLRPRLKFYYDVKNKMLPETMAVRAAQILQESWDLRVKLESLLDNLQASDSEAEVSEADLAQSVKMRLQLSNLKREMEILENPIVRSLVLKDGPPQPGSPYLDRDYPVTHIVGSKVTFKMIKSLSLDEETVILVRQFPDEAIMLSTDGDTILICPGTYRCESLCWIEQNITLKGLGKAEDVIIEAMTGSGDIFLNFAAENVKLCNLTIKPDAGMKATLLVHKGQLTLDSCILEGQAISHLLVLGEAKVDLVGCTISTAMDDGIQVRLGARLSIKSSIIQKCSGNGIRLEGGPQFGIFRTHLNIRNVQCSDNGSYGITIETESCHPEPLLTWDSLMSIPWLSLEVENVSCLGNGKGPLGVTPSPIASPPKEYEKFLDSISHHVQSLSVSSQSCVNLSGNANSSTDAVTLSLSSSDDDCFEEPVNLNKTLTGTRSPRPSD